MQWAPGKKSIFNIDDTYDETDLNAPDVEDMEQESKPKQKPASFYHNCFIGQGNNPSLAKDSLINLGFKVMQRGMQFSNEYRMKWT